MGGGDASADVVRSSCILTFPEECMAEPVPVDAWYLHAVGLLFLRRLARDRVGDDMRISLLMQKTDPETGIKRYIAVSSDAMLKQALQETFDQPDSVLVLHIISLADVPSQKTIHVRPEINPNVSPEPVPPMGMVFPTLTVEAQQVPTERERLMHSMSQSMFDLRKPDPPMAFGSASMNLGKSVDLAKSCTIMEQDFTWRAPKQADSKKQKETAKPAATTEPHEELFTFANVGKQLMGGSDDSISGTPSSLSITPVLPSTSTACKTSSSDQDDEIPMARVVGQPTESEASRITSDYVMLELQNGAGLSDQPLPAGSSSTYFISSHWHVQADEMSASMRLERPASQAPSQAPREPSTAGSASALEDSFVLLERHEL